ncbi:MAG: bacillithiol biosynthesis deacetylase BshB1 [bacterium]|nr:bacillithiol biosynthesis deacetylase BshB1 [bacterium]
MVDVLVISPHPDDVELGCGGTVAKFVQLGRRVALFDLTQGELGSRGNAAMRLSEAQAAAQVLGVSFRENGNLPDGHINAADHQQRLVVIDAIRKYRPQILIYPYPEDRHPDHGATGKLCEEAVFLAGLQKLETSFPPHRPQFFFAFHQAWEGKVSFIVDISDTWEIKKKAILCFQSQFYHPYSNEPETWIAQPNFLEGIEARARTNGFKIRVQYGESFWHRGPLPLFDLTYFFKAPKRIL